MIQCRTTRIPPGRAELARGGAPSRKNSKNSASRFGDGGAVADAAAGHVPGRVELIQRALQPHPDTASISLAFRAVRNSWNPLDACK